MEHFVSIITKTDQLEEHLVESVLSSANVGLLESETNYQLFETDSKEQVLRVQLHRQLSEEESDTFAEDLANKLFEMGYNEFDIEVSTDETSEDLPFDIVEDLHVFMKNDTMFYRRSYFPTMSKIADAVRQKKKINFTKAVTPMISQAVDAYCKKFDLPKNTKELFKDEEHANLVAKIREEESENIRKGEY